MNWRATLPFYSERPLLVKGEPGYGRYHAREQLASPWAPSSSLGHISDHQGIRVFM